MANPYVNIASLATIDTTQVVRYDDLIGWWPLIGFSHLGCADMSGNDRNGAPIGAPTTSATSPGVSDILNSCFEFNGSTQYISLPTLPAASDWSICIWAYLTADVLSYVFGVGSNIGMFGKDPSYANSWGFRNSAVITGSVVPLNEWHLMIVSKNGTTYSLFLDGVADGSGTLSSVAIGPSQIGRRPNGAGPTAGRLVDARMYSVPLDVDDAAAIFAGDVVALPGGGGGGISNRGLLTGGRR